MSDVVTTFPLLRLPKNAAVNTLELMNYLHIFGISVLSKKSKNLVQSLNITTSEFEVYLNTTLSVRLTFHDRSWIDFELYEVLENEPLQDVETPGNINVRYRNTRVTWTNSLSVKELLDHFQIIFHSSINLLYFGFDSERFSVESIHRNVKKMDRIKIYNDNDEQSRKVLSLFRPASFDIGDSALIDKCVPKNVLIQNLEQFYTRHSQITLDKLLMTNAQQIHISCDRLSVKTINQFLHLWAKGSNLRMEYLYLGFVGKLQTVELFRGLDYKKASPRRRRYFVTGGEEELEVDGGWDFWRFDGTEATVIFCSSGDVTAFFMYVWHDHCVGY